MKCPVCGKEYKIIDNKSETYYRIGKHILKEHYKVVERWLKRNPKKWKHIKRKVLKDLHPSTPVAVALSGKVYTVNTTEDMLEEIKKTDNVKDLLEVLKKFEKEVDVLSKIQFSATRTWVVEYITRSLIREREKERSDVLQDKLIFNEPVDKLNTKVNEMYEIVKKMDHKVSELIRMLYHEREHLFPLQNWVWDLKDIIEEIKQIIREELARREHGFG